MHHKTEQRIKHPTSPINSALLYNSRHIQEQIQGSLGAVNCLITPSYIAFSDVLSPMYKLEAWVDFSGVLEFHLFTRDQTKKQFPKTRHRHPDMSAKDFVLLSFRHFEKHKVTVNACKSTWYPYNSDNYDTFCKIYEQTHDLVLAAQSTWSGKVFTQLGFSHITKNDILVEYEQENNGAKIAQITAIFKK